MAFRMQSSVPELTDLSGEPGHVVDLYGPEARRPGTYAANCLLARRLVERGVRFVNLYHASWDHHSDLDRELAFNCGMADRPVAALLKDLKRRGLLETTLVLWVSEFGRTPLGENRAGYKAVTGRDHHPFAFTIWMAGGGVRAGQVLGKTDEIGWNVVEDPVHVNDFHATALHLFGLDHLRLTYRFQGRDFRLTDVAGKVVNKLLA
jgi:arylsulfatase A-like enzyme